MKLKGLKIVMYDVLLDELFIVSASAAEIMYWPGLYETIGVL